MLERFLAQCVDHDELRVAPELAAFCVADPRELARCKTAYYEALAARPPFSVRVGAMLLDVVGDATPVVGPLATPAVSERSLVISDGSPVPDHELLCAKRREAEVRELHAWARDRVVEISKCEKECTEGAAALRAFDAACTAARSSLASRFVDANSPGLEASTHSLSDSTSALQHSQCSQFAESVRVTSPRATPSGPARALRALREMVGLARALCEAIETRDRVRLLLVAAGNALELSKASRRAREAMLEASYAQQKRAHQLKREMADTRRQRERADELKRTALARAFGVLRRVFLENAARLALA